MTAACAPEPGPRRVLVVAGGARPVEAAMVRVGPVDVVVAADSGIDHARELGCTPSVAVGDFDSVSPQGLAWASESGVALHSHRPDKDDTDLALALDAAAAMGPSEVVAVGIEGGRPDHFLANLAVLGDQARVHAGACTVRAEAVDARYWFVADRLSFDPGPCSVVTLLALGGDATGVRTTGLHYVLDGETLSPLSSRGVSNVVSGDTVTIEADSGLVLVIGVLDGPDPVQEFGR